MKRIISEMRDLVAVMYYSYTKWRMDFYWKAFFKGASLWK